MVKPRALLSLAVFLSLAGCSRDSLVGLLPRKANYIESGELELAAFPPPPAPGSEADRADLALLHQWQDRRTREQCARARSEADASYDEMFGDVSPFAKPMDRATIDILDRVRSDTRKAIVVLKGRYRRPRPFLRDSGLDPCLGRIGGLSYPSGHATTARVFARLLSDVAPERRARFMARADEAALNRVLGGVHHPSDIEAGKLLGDRIYSGMLKSPAFQNDLQALRRELATR